MSAIHLAIGFPVWTQRADLIRAVKASTDELSSQIDAHIAGGQAA